MYSIKAVTSITGINAETLRAWERRYGAVIPQRDKSGRRIYSPDDVERLTLLHKAREAGHSISKLAKLQSAELDDLLSRNDQTLNLNNEMIFVQVVDALMQYRLDKCEDLLRRALIAMDPVQYAQDFLMPLLIKVGELWHEGRLSITQEHMFSNCVKRIVLSLVHNLMPFSGGQIKLIFATLPGEQHEFGILLSCLLAANQGCTCYYLGSSLPVEELVNAQKKLSADVIVLSLVNTEKEEETSTNLQQLVAEIDEKTALWIGGAGAKKLMQDSQIEQHLSVFKDLTEFSSQLNLTIKQIA